MTRTLGIYELVAMIGTGGMAEVVLAVRGDQLGFGLDKLVVIKRLREGLATDETFITMLLDEARLAARLNHPNIVQTYEVGCIDGRYHLVMEYLDGQPLSRILRRLSASGEPSTALACTALCEVLAALDYAHSLEDFSGRRLNVVHRDVSPQNVFITYDGAVKLVDFGIAKAVGRITETRHGVIKGKIAYMSPQQAIGKEVDGRADIFSVGTMLFEAVAGERLWRGKKQLDIVRSLVAGDIPSSPKERNPAVSAELDAVCKKALAFNIDDRYATAGDAQVALEQVLRSDGLIMSRREMGRIVSAMFGEQRAELRAIVESELENLREKHTSDLPTLVAASPNESRSESYSSPGSSSSSSRRISVSASPRRESDSSGRRSQNVRLGARDSGRRSSRSAVTLEPAARRRPWLRGWLPLVAGATGIIGITAAVTLGLNGGLRPSEEQPPATPTPTTSASGTAAGDKVKVVFRATPSTAQFRIDNGPPLENPFLGELPRSSERHTITAFAAGYKDRIREIRLERSVTVELALERNEAPAAGP